MQAANRHGTFLVAVVVAIFAGCEESIVSPVVDDGIPTGEALKLQVAHDSLFYGKTLALTFTDDGDTTEVPPEYEWSSSDTSVAVVDDTGGVIAVGLGVARITIQREGARDR